MLSLGAALRQSRKLRKYSQDELAREVGLSRSAIVALEDGRGRMVSLCQVLPVCPVRIVGLPPAPTHGQQIAVAREVRGFSLAAAAKAAGLAQNTVRNVECDVGNVAAFLRLCAALSADFTVHATLPKKTQIWRTVAGAHNLHRDSYDYYATPLPVTRLLLEHVEFDRTGSVLEPCVGEARAVEFALLESEFQNVSCFDIQALGSERRDFFTVGEQYDYLITNPPFRGHVSFIKHAKRVATRKIALLFPLTYLTGSGRLEEVWSDTAFPLAEVLVLNRGFDFLGDPFAETLRPTQMYMAWFIWSREHTGPPTVRWIDVQHLMGPRRRSA